MIKHILILLLTINFAFSESIDSNTSTLTDKDSSISLHPYLTTNIIGIGYGQLKGSDYTADIYGVGGDFSITDNIQTTLVNSKSNGEKDVDINIDMNIYSFGLLYNFSPNERITPIIGLSISRSNYEFTYLDNSIEYESLNIGIYTGVDYRINKDFLVNGMVSLDTKTISGDIDIDDSKELSIDIDSTYFFLNDNFSGITMGYSRDFALESDDEDKDESSISLSVQYLMVEDIVLILDYSKSLEDSSNYYGFTANYLF